jgi:hypothetical protein
VQNILTIRECDAAAAVEFARDVQRRQSGATNDEMRGQRRRRRIKTLHQTMQDEAEDKSMQMLVSQRLGVPGEYRRPDPMVPRSQSPKLHREASDWRLAWADFALAVVCLLLGLG